VVGRSAALAAAVEVEDDLPDRVRLPADILRCVTACVEIAILIGIALVAKQTASGVEVDLVTASKKLATGLTTPLYFVASLALLILPIVLAGRMIYRRQFRRLAEAALIGAAAAAITLGLDALLHLGALQTLAKALARQNHEPGSPSTPISPGSSPTSPWSGCPGGPGGGRRSGSRSGSTAWPVWRRPTA
jgi:hypothetical protein